MKRFEEVDELKVKLDAHRPIPPEMFQTIAEKLRIDWTYNTTRIEGGPLTYRETAFFVRTGQTSKGRSLEAYLEYRGHLYALDYLEELVREKEKLSERAIKEFHSLLLRGVEWVEVPNERGEKVKKRIYPGSYKTENNHVVKLDGAIHRFCEHTQVPGEMERLIAWYEEHREQLHPIELATEMHHRLVAIHPFTDGNGRVARLVMNLILMEAGYVSAIIHEEDRQEYFTALDAADEGDIEPLLTIVEREVIRTLRLMLDVIEGRTALDERDLSRKFEGFGKRMEALERDYQKSRAEWVGIARSGTSEVAQYLREKCDKFVEERKHNRFEITVHDLNVQEVVFGGDVMCFGGIVNYPGILKLRNIMPDKSTGARGCEIIIQASEEPLRMYFPLAKLFFATFASTSDVHVFSMPWIEMLNFETGNEGVDIERVKANVELLEGDFEFESWDKQELDEFFVRSVSRFLDEVEKEVERRKRYESEEGL